ncbi:MAG: SpoIID/LytB domain-containing protein [Lachnospiraceae bacterium]|nr:SpoIID/LytB domain-containing protein [Lachnospiraceae bacterium]
MGRQTDPMVKTKLYLLAIGILLLAILLVRGRTKEEEKPENTEPQPAREEPKEPEKEAEEEPKIQTPIYNGRIRVLIKTDDFEEEMHESVRLASDQELVVQKKGAADGDVYGEGTELSFSFEEGSLCLNGEAVSEPPDCFTIAPKEEGQASSIRLESITRGYGIPSYEGVMEIWPAKEGFVIVNEVPLETYLNYVVPSEMPSRYAKEALKAQAVCARTYAYKQLQSYGYPEYEAHVDDSVRYQVYNNTSPADSTNEAVAETADLILTSQGQPITAYYFSTSCGYTGNEEVWWEGSRELTPYLRGKTVNEAGECLDMTDEEVFTAFILNKDDSCYDSMVGWYRWETELSVEALSENLNEALKKRYEANPEAIRTKRGRDYVSRPIETIGTIQGIDILKRNEGGAVSRMCIRGSRRTIEVETEYNVRALLNVQGGRIVKQDGTVVDGTALLPSAYFIATPVFDEEGELSSYRFQGGGYGHGVGMSQNGANGMAEQGKSCEEILRFFYTDVELTAIHTL